MKKTFITNTILITALMLVCVMSLMQSPLLSYAKNNNTKITAKNILMENESAQASVNGVMLFGKKWKSDNKSVCTITEQGMIKAKKSGTTKISCVVNKKRIYKKITVISLKQIEKWIKVETFCTVDDFNNNIPCYNNYAKITYNGKGCVDLTFFANIITDERSFDKFEIQNMQKGDSDILVLGSSKTKNDISIHLSIEDASIEPAKKNTKHDVNFEYFFDNKGIYIKLDTKNKTDLDFSNVYILMYNENKEIIGLCDMSENGYMNDGWIHAYIDYPVEAKLREFPEIEDGEHDSKYVFTKIIPSSCDYIIHDYDYSENIDFP